METIITFLLKSIIVSGLFCCIYALLLKDRRLHNYNRFFLLFSLYASIQIPLLQINRPESGAKLSATFQVPEMMLHSRNAAEDLTENIGKIPPSYYSPATIIMVILLFISICLLSALMIRIIKIRQLGKKYPHISIDGIRIIQTNLPEAPFCFLNRIYWRSDLPMHTADGRLILQHELTHIRQRHTYDKLAAQVMTCILWMNPFYWLIQKELALIHEFIADEKSIKHDQGITKADYSKTLARMLLQAHNHGHYFQPGQHFFSSSLKRRFIMLQTNNRVRGAVLRCTAILPVIAVSIFIFGMKSPDTSEEPVIKAANKIVLVIDPGHGGTDKGCSTTSLTEKDLTLKLALRMVQLAPEYNIDVRLTRSTDAFVSLQDRAAFANSLHPDGLLSLHIDSAPEEAPGKGKFDIIVNSKSRYPEKSKQLATSIYKHLYRPDWEQRKKPSDKSLYILKKNFSPAVLIELGNIHNAAQMEYFSDNKKLDIIAGQILQGVVEAYQ